MRYPAHFFVAHLLAGAATAMSGCADVKKQDLVDVLNDGGHQIAAISREITSCADSLCEILRNTESRPLAPADSNRYGDLQRKLQSLQKERLKIRLMMSEQEFVRLAAKSKALSDEIKEASDVGQRSALSAKKKGIDESLAVAISQAAQHDPEYQRGLRVAAVVDELLSQASHLDGVLDNAKTDAKAAGDRRVSIAWSAQSEFDKMAIYLHSAVEWVGKSLGGDDVALIQKAVDRASEIISDLKKKEPEIEQQTRRLRLAR